MARTSTDGLQSYALSVMRAVAGFTFSLHGVQKILGLLGGVGGKGTTASFGSLSWTAGILELCGGILLMLGLFTRPTAFILSGMMAFAYFMSHAPRGFFPLLNGGELAALYSFVFLYLCTAGAGSWSLDRIVRKKS